MPGLTLGVALKVGGAGGTTLPALHGLLGDTVHEVSGTLIGLKVGGEYGGTFAAARGQRS